MCSLGLILYIFYFQLWNQYFQLSVTFLTQPGLQLERFRENKREQILKQYGDLRVRMGSQIEAMWNRLGMLI